MEKDFGINSKIELYKRLMPALNCKIRELERLNVRYVKKEDIWNYLLKEKWENITGLDLSTMVDDILNLDNQDLINFLSKKTNNYKNDENIINNELELL
ncbi:MAG: hypothetical protein IJ568_02215 [Bacilli bacterium]|nr:hypothetical protein [Bacilli bacterium]